MKTSFLPHYSSHYQFPWKRSLISHTESSEFKINTAKSARRGARCRGASTASVWHSRRHVQAHHLNKMAATKPPHNQVVPKASPCLKCESLGHRWSSSPQGSATRWTTWRHYHHFFVTSPWPPITVYLLHPSPCWEQFCLLWCPPAIERFLALALLPPCRLLIIHLSEAPPCRWDLAFLNSLQIAEALQTTQTSGKPKALQQFSSGGRHTVSLALEGEDLDTPLKTEGKDIPTVICSILHLNLFCPRIIQNIDDISNLL